MIPIPDALIGRECDLGSTTVTAEMIAAYMTAVGNPPAEPPTIAPSTFCLALRRGMVPEIQLPAGVFAVYGGHDLEFLHPIRAGETYHTAARIAEVYEKMGRSGALTIIVRAATVRDVTGRPVARITERQVLRRAPTPHAPSA